MSDGTSNEVSVIADLTNTVLARFTVGDHPEGIAYDSGRHEVFVANYFSDNVSVISDSTNRVVGSIGVGQNPVAIAYDSGQNEVYVANYLDDNVSVLSDRTNTVVGTIPMPGHPEERRLRPGYGRGPHHEQPRPGRRERHFGLARRRGRDGTDRRGSRRPGLRLGERSGLRHELPPGHGLGYCSSPGRTRCCSRSRASRPGPGGTST